MTAKTRITPACAGSTLPRRYVSVLARDHPRLRGEYGIFQKFHSMQHSSPPLARGVRRTPEREHHPVRITPACAGSTCRLLRRGKINWDHPRLRGEYRLSSLKLSPRLGSPPLARGVLTLPCEVSAPKGITPACAGSTWQILHIHKLHQDHPRLRGEYATCCMNLLPTIGSPPLARGVL